MSEKRFQLNMMRNPSRILDNGKVISKYNTVVLLNKFYEENQELKEENEQLKKQLSKYDKLKISIFNKDKGDWKWNDNNDIILNIRNGKSFYLRNSGAVENLVDLLNEQQDKITELEIELTDCKNRKEQSEYNLRRENEQLRKQVAECKMILRQHEFAEKEGFQ